MESKKLIQWKENYTVLLLSIAISFFLWMMLKMSSYHTFTQTININYEVPKSMTLADVPISSLEVLIRGEGWDLIKSNLNKSTLELDILLNTDTIQYFSETALLDLLRKNVQDNFIQIMSVNPSNIVVNLSSTYQKNVPIILKSDIEFYPDHDFSKEISIEPDSVTIYGPQELLDSIQTWNTEILKLTNLKNSVSKTLKLTSPDSELVKLNTYSVLVDIEVEEFTEKVVELPIQVLSKSGQSTDTYRALPEKARVYAIIPLSMYEFPSLDEFKLIAEVDETQLTDKSNKVPLKLALYPGYVKSFKIHPNTIDLFYVTE